MHVIILSLFFLLLLAVGGLGAYLSVCKKQARTKDDRPNIEADTIRALGLRSLGSSHILPSVENEEAKKRLLSLQNPDSFTISKPRVRQYTDEYSKISTDAIDEMLVIIEKMAKDLRECLRQFENAPLEAQYCSTKDIASSLIFARQLQKTLEQRAELVEVALAPPSPDYKRAYEIATEGVLLSSD